MSLRNARPPNALSSSNSIWISDQHLSKAFRRFTASCVAKRKLHTEQCLRGALPSQTKRAPRDRPTSKLSHYPPSSRPLSRDYSSRPPQWPSAALLTSAQGTHSTNNRRPQEQRRHGHNVPGPLEARRRLNRRRLNYASAGVQSGGAPPMDPSVLMGDIWGRPKQPYWEYQAPSWKPDREKESRHQGKLPDWLTQSWEPPPPAPAPQLVSMADVQAEQSVNNGVDVSSYDLHAQGAISLKTFKARLALLSNVDDVDRLCEELRDKQQQDSAFGLAAFNHLLFQLFEETKVVNRIPNYEDLNACRSINCALKHGQPEVALGRLASLAVNLKANGGSSTQGRLMLGMFKVVWLKNLLVNVAAHQVLSGLSAAVQLAQLVPEDALSTQRTFIVELLERSRFQTHDERLDLAMELDSKEQALIVLQLTLSTLTEDIGQGLSADTDLKGIMSRLLTSVQRLECAASEGPSATTVKQIHDIMLSLCLFPSVTEESSIMLGMLAWSLSIPDLDPYQAQMLALVERILCRHDLDSELLEEQVVIELLDQYAQKILSLDVASSSPSDNGAEDGAPLITRLFDAAPAAVCHEWFLRTSLGLITSFADTRGSQQLGFLETWLRWGSLSSSIRERQQDLDNPDVANFFFRLFDQLRPSHAPYALAPLDSSQVSRVLIRHFLVGKDFHCNFNPVESMLDCNWPQLKEQLQGSREAPPSWVLYPQASSLEVIQTMFETELETLGYQRAQERQRAREAAATTWVRLKRDTVEDRYQFDGVVQEDRMINYSKLNRYNRSDRFARGKPLRDDRYEVVPYLALFITLVEHLLSWHVIERVVHEVVLYLTATEQHYLVSNLLLILRTHLSMPFSEEMDTLVVQHITDHANRYPSGALGLYNKSLVPLTSVPDLIENLVASTNSTVHPKQIMPLFRYLNRVTRSIRHHRYHDEDLPPQSLSPFSTNQIHTGALASARASRFSTNTAYNCVAQLYQRLRDYNAPIDSRMSRALVVAGVLRPIHEGLSHKIQTARFRWILDVVREVEGEVVANKVDVMAQEAYVRERTRISQELRARRRRSMSGPRFSTRLGDALAPRVEDFGNAVVDEGVDERPKPYRYRQRVREEQAGVYGPQERVEGGKVQSFRYI